MPVLSGTNAYSLVVDDILTEAWERCGKAADVLTGKAALSAIRSLQMILLTWTNMGLNLWQVKNVTGTLTPNTDTFALTPDLIDVLEINLTIAPGIERNIGLISRTAFELIPSKMIQSSPTQVWVERVQPAPILHFYPTPDIAYAFNFNAIRLPYDVNGLLQLIDAPILWADALAAELAARLALKFAPDRLADLRDEAKAIYGAASGENRERVPLTVTPENWC